jgi:hypothetical protein
MRFDLRLHGHTSTGRKCVADISAYAGSQKELQKQADLAAQKAAWLAVDSPHDPISEGSEIVIEHVERI